MKLNNIQFYDDYLFCHNSSIIIKYSCINAITNSQYGGITIHTSNSYFDIKPQYKNRCELIILKKEIMKRTRQPVSTTLDSIATHLQKQTELLDKLVNNISLQIDYAPGSDKQQEAETDFKNHLELLSK